MLRIFPTETRVASAAGGRQRCSRPATHSWPAYIVLRTMWEALRDGLAAHRHYEELRSWAPSQPARERITPLCFAGRA